MAKEKKAAICGVCPGGCAVDVTLEDGRLTDIARRPDVPFGGLCVRGRHAAEVLYSPDRLKTPLIRCGERGEGKFRAAGWDEALDTVVANLQRIKGAYGPQAVASHSGRGAFEQAMNDFVNGGDGVASRLLWPFGSPNIGSVSSVCFVSYGILAPMTTYGVYGMSLLPDVDNSSLLVVWGANPATDSPPFFHERVIRAQQKGARLIAIDHMRSDIAARADQWIAPRPGTDGALALGLLRVIINERLYDREFVEKWTAGFAELAAYVQQFTPARVAAITGVEAAVVEALARELAAAKHATLRLYTGLEYSNCGVQSIRAVYILWALTGNLDVPGGLLLKAGASGFQKTAVPRPDGPPPIGAAEHPVFYRLTGCAQFMEFPKAVLAGKPYPIKALLSNGASMLTSYPQPPLWEEAFRRLEFMAVIDRFMTRDAMFADVVLPATTYFEIASYQRYHGFVRLRERVVPPVGQARNDLFIIAELAARLGYGELFPQNERELLARAFARQPGLADRLAASPAGVALPSAAGQFRKYESGLLRRDGRPGFNTPSGKLEIASALLAECGYDALPVYAEPAEGPLASPDLQRRFPLILNTGARIHSTFRSQHLNIPGLLRLQPAAQVLVHPDDAAARVIADGDEVTVSTVRGRVNFRARVTDDVRLGVVEANVGGGSPIQGEGWREANTNLLTAMDNRDPISGFPVLKALLCQVEKAGARE